MPMPVHILLSTFNNVRLAFPMWMLGPLGQVQTTVTTALFINHHVNLHGLSTMLHPYMMRNHTKKRKLMYGGILTQLRLLNRQVTNSTFHSYCRDNDAHSRYTSRSKTDHQQ